MSVGRLSSFARFSWACLAYNVGVILWGAYVRATGSGAGCGNHWPLCDGVVIPRPDSVERMIEFSHRASSGLSLLLSLAALWWAMRSFESEHRVRRGAWAVVALMLIEAAVGAALVKFGLVNQNQSVARAVVIGIHLTNTFLLLAALSLTAWWASGGPAIRLRGQGALGAALCFGLLLAIGLGITGAITALGDTLFPIQSTSQAVARGLSAEAHFLERQRLAHPLVAVSVGLYLLLVTGLAANLRPSTNVRRLGQGVIAAFFLQMILGLASIALKAPVAMQMLHLFVADVIWVQLVLFCASAMSADQPAPESDAAVGVRPAEFGSATWRDYLALTKPRIISLLLLTTLAAMFIAAGGWPGGWLLLAVSIGGYAAAGAANAINMVIERDLDARMERTAGRPTVTERIPAQRALAFAFALGLAGFALLWSAANLLAAVLAFAGLVFYVIVYTLALKRRTWQNIVIGGAAGAFPPLVGWSAVTGELHLLAWYLFAIVFFWTPVHFWALALIMKDEYALAGIPMLPVVRGDRVTVIQIALYTLLTIVISLMPLAQRLVGPFYFSAAVVLNLVLLVRAAQLFQIPERPRARSLFKYSMAYLALLFLAMAIDRSLAAKTSTHSDEHPSPASRVSS